MRSWFKARLGRMRVSTVALIVAFLALFWVYHNFEPRPASTAAPTTAVVPPGFVPDPNYTWVPRTNVRREPETTTETTTPTTTPTETTTPSPDDDHDQPDVADRAHPTTTVVDPDGPGGPLGPQTFTQTPDLRHRPTTASPVPGTVPATPAAPR